MKNNLTSYGYLLPTRGLVIKGGKAEFDTILQLSKLAESSGFTSIWVGDSVLAKPRLEPLTTLAAVATVCPKSLLGMAVLLPALRQPVVLAHALNTLDLIAHGRLLIGVGNGGPFEIYKKEFAGCGVPFKERISRTDETVKVLKLLWNNDHVNFSGKTCNLDDVSLEPKSYTAGGPKILMSAGIPLTDKSAHRVANLTDGWMTAQAFPGEYRETWDRITKAEPEKELIPSFYMTVNINKDEASAKKETNDYLTKYYGSAQSLDRWGPFGTPDQVTRGLNAFYDAGVRVFSIRFSSFDQEEQITTFAEKILPNLNQ